jgi:hypothetical protein
VERNSASASAELRTMSSSAPRLSFGCWRWRWTGRSGLRVDRDQRVSDGVVELVRQAQALLIEAVQDRCLASLLSLLCPGFNERKPAPPGVPGHERAEQQGEARERRPDAPTGRSS